MPFTRTVSYTQNVPVSIGWASYMNPSPSRNVVVVFDFAATLADSKMGQINIPETTGVAITLGQYTADENVYGQIRLEGEVSAVNTALNNATYSSKFYPVENLDQAALSQFRLSGDARGELCVQINPTVTHGLSAGSFVRFSTVPSPNNVTGQFQVTAVDGTNSPSRIWMAFRGGYGTNEAYYGGSYKSVSTSRDSVLNALQTAPATKTYTINYLQTSAGVNIAPVVDVWYCNPHGSISIGCIIIDGTTEVNTYNFNGTFFTPEPSFTSTPVATVAATTGDTWYPNLVFGTIAQADDNYQNVQLAIKLYENDPLYLNVSSYANLNGYPTTPGPTLITDQLTFIGNAIDAKALGDIPTYVVDNSYGMFSYVQVGERIATTTPGLSLEATAVATILNQSVNTITVTSGSQGYVTAPLVNISAPDVSTGTQATATATISNGRVTAVTITSAGSGYTTVPTITIDIPTTGIIRWNFYGTPTDCNTALKQISYFRPASNLKDFIVETRIVNGKSRIFSSRGKA